MIRPEPLHQLGRERTGAAADVERLLTAADAREVGEQRRERHRVPAHEPVVGVGCDREAHSAIYAVGPTSVRVVDVARALRHMSVMGLLVVGALVLASGAGGVHGDRDGYDDALIREQPYLPYANVGANCDLYYNNGTWIGRLYIRPPRLWGLKGLGRQAVRWRTRFYDIAQNGTVVWTTKWHYGRVKPLRATDFAGGPDAPQAMIHWKSYWDGSHWYQHPQGNGMRVRAVVDVGWYKARSRKWISRSMTVRWMISTANRTIGEGQLGPASTPVRDRWEC